MSTSINHIDPNIVKGCLKDDRASQNALYKQYYSYGMSISIRYVDSRDEAAAVLNDAFYKIFKNFKKYDTSKSFKPWLSRIIVNTAITYIKKKKKSEFVNIDSIAEVSDTVEEVKSNVSYADILKLIQGLSTAYKTVFNLYVIDGYKHEEIAEQLGISIGTSKSNLSRAKQHLREKLKDQINSQYV